MAQLTRITDAKGRITLPRGFANTTVLVEEISPTEVRIRKARVIPENEITFAEENRPLLSDRDRDLFIKLLQNPPPANAALRRAARRHGKLVHRTS